LNHGSRKVRDWRTRVADWLHLSPFRYEPRGPERLPLASSDPVGVLLANLTEVGNMDGELAPRDGLHELLQRTKASGEHDEGVGEPGHAVFSLMHGADHVETGQAGGGRSRDRTMTP
jgi:hypothetical protein